MFNTTEDILMEAKKTVYDLDLGRKGDDIIVAAGMPTTKSGCTNMMKIEKL